MSRNPYIDDINSDYRLIYQAEVKSIDDLADSGIVYVELDGINNGQLIDRKIKASSIYLNKMKESLESTKQVMEISNNKRLKTKDKIRMIQELLPEESITFIANVLNMSRQAVHRHL